MWWCVILFTTKCASINVAMSSLLCWGTILCMARYLKCNPFVWSFKITRCISTFLSSVVKWLNIFTFPVKLFGFISKASVLNLCWLLLCFRSRLWGTLWTKREKTKVHIFKSLPKCTTQTHNCRAYEYCASISHDCYRRGKKNYYRQYVFNFKFYLLVLHLLPSWKFTIVHDQG